jgi:hypothetical protein
MRLCALLAALLPRLSLSVLPYGHAFNSPGDFDASQYAFIASTFPVFTVEVRLHASPHALATA